MELVRVYPEAPRFFVEHGWMFMQLICDSGAYTFADGIASTSPGRSGARTR